MLVLNGYWLNLKTLAWPTNLALSYGPLRPERFLHGPVILGGVALCLTCLTLWKLRRFRLVLFGLTWFGLALAPTSQLMPHHIHRADRFLYLPLVGLVAALGVSLRPLGHAKPRLMVAVVSLGVACLLVLDILSARQVQTWRNSVTVWEHCVRVAPNNPEAHRALADSLAQQGQFDRAFRHYQKALEIEPAYIDVLRNFAFHLATCSDGTLRDDDLAIKLAERGCELTNGRDRGLLRILATAYTNRAIALERGGQFQPAMEYYNRAIQADPNYDLALFDLAFLLATCPDQALRNGEDAVRLAERACQLVSRPDAIRLSVLAAAYAETGRFQEAITAVEDALELPQPGRNAGLLQELERQLNLYRNGGTFRHPP
jgi:tetratricopeptide (TPR) repeat protein